MNAISPGDAHAIAMQSVASATTPPDIKRPLFRPLLPARSFPMEALGPLQAAAEAIHERTQAPPAMCAQAVLAAATLAVQQHRDVQMPDGSSKPLTGIFATIAESGERKTTVDRIALAPVYRIEEGWRADREVEMEAYRNDREAWSAAREKAKKSNKGDRAAIRAALAAIGEEPKQPPQAMLLVEDFSPEALVLHLRDSRPWCGVFTSEGGALVGGHAFNEEKAMQTGALLNTLWDGSPIRRVRVLTGNAFLPGRRCSAHVMMQQIVADKLLSDPVLDGIGLTARVLMVAPDSTVGTRLFRTAPSHCDAALRDYGNRITALLKTKPRLADGAVDVLAPLPLEMALAAREEWIAFHDSIETNLGEGGALRPIRAFGAKMPEHAARLAAALTVYENPDAMEVGKDAMRAGIALTQHYGSETLRLAGGAAVAPDLHLASKLLSWWQTRDDRRCHLATIYQRGPYAIREATVARRIVAVLEEHGWIVRLPPGTEIDGSPRRDAWSLVP